MTDESFKYTFHHPDGSKEVKVGNNYDVYISLKDKIDLEICKLERQIYEARKYTTKKYTTNMCSLLILALAFVGTALTWRW